MKKDIYAGFTLAQLQELIESCNNYKYFDSEYQRKIRANHFDKVNVACRKALEEILNEVLNIEEEIK